MFINDSDNVLRNKRLSLAFHVSVKLEYILHDNDKVLPNEHIAHNDKKHTHTHKNNNQKTCFLCLSLSRSGQVLEGKEAK